MRVVRKDLIRFIFIPTVLSFLFFAKDGNSAVFNVINSAELQTALTTAAANGENDTINLAAGTYNTATMTFTYMAAASENFDLTLDGASAGTTILDGGNVDQVLRIDTTGVTMPNDSAVIITISDLTIRNGMGVVGTDGNGGGLRVSSTSADLTVQNSTISMNTTNGLGGGLYATTAGDVMLSNLMFTNNSSSASDGGGAFIQNAGQVNITNTDFTTNTANSDGGGLGLMNVVGDTTLTDNTFDDNDATTGDGGGLANLVTGMPQNDMTLMGNTFTENTAGDDGGGLFSSTAGNVTLEDDTFNGNSAANVAMGADPDGGAAFIQNAELLMITGGTFSNNSATSDGGGLLALDVENLTLTDSTFNDNTATNGHGGGLADLVTGMLLNSATLTGNTFADNTAGDGGGGAAVEVNGDLNAGNNAFTGNSSVGDGGGFHAGAQNLTLNMNEVYENTAGSNGGGVAISADEDVNAMGNTFTENSAGGDGGGASVGATGDVDAMGNTFTDNSAGGEGGGLLAEAENLTLDANEFDSNIALAYGGGLHASVTENAIVTNHIFINNSSDENGGGADITADDATLTNNTFTLNSAEADGGGLNLNINDATSANIYNNIIFDNSAAGDGVDIFVNDDVNANLTGSTVNLFNNDFSDFFSICENTINCMPNINRGSNIDADPLFVNAAGGDVNLTSNSPAINLGDPAAPDLPATDFAGNPRTVGPAPDMGALEFTGASSIDVTIVKSSDLSEVKKGRRVDITYTIILENTGTQSATGITVEEALPEGATLVGASQGCLEDVLGIVTCDVGTLGTGAERTLTITINLKPRGDEILNDAILRFLGAGGVTVEKNSNSVVITIKEAGGGCSLVRGGPAKLESTATNMIVLLIPGLVLGMRALRRKIKR